MHVNNVTWLDRMAGRQVSDFAGQYDQIAKLMMAWNWKDLNIYILIDLMSKTPPLNLKVPRFPLQPNWLDAKIASS